MMTSSFLIIFSLAAMSVEVAEASAASPATAAASSTPPYLRRLKSHPPQKHDLVNQHWIDYKKKNIAGSKSKLDPSFCQALKIPRGGSSIWVRSKTRGQSLDATGEGGNSVEAKDEYEYEYEYYDEVENYPAEDTEDNHVQDKYGGEEEKATSNFGEKIQDVDEGFLDQEDADFANGDVKVGSEEKNDGIVNGIEAEEKFNQGGGVRSFWGQRKSDTGSDAKDGLNTESTNNEGYNIQDSSSEATDKLAAGGGEGTDEHEDLLFTTPIPSGDPSLRSLQLANRTVPKTEMEGEYKVDHAEDEEEYEEDLLIEEGANSNDSRNNDLFETPIAPESASTAKKATAGKSAQSSKRSNKSNWWQCRSHMPETSQRRRWRPASSSRASFIPPLFYTGAPQSFSLHSSSGRPSYSKCLSSISNALSAIFQPIRNVIQLVTFSVASSVSKWISVSFSLVRNSFEFLWYGPVDGVTTTGIATREGGLSALLVSSPVAITMLSFAVIGLMMVIRRKLWQETDMSGGIRGYFLRGNDTRAKDGYDDEEYSDEEIKGPPSVEEELDFLNREFDPANPSSKDRIAEAIVKQNRFTWPSRRGDRPKSRRGQRQFTIKSIQTWWKKRPSQSVAIIEPQHIRNQLQPLSREIKRLQKQLTVSEQERAVLQQDVQRLQQRLQKAHHDSRSILSQNKWLEKQTSKADQILTNAVNVERMKANKEMGRVRESMKEVLERERMLMRGRNAGPKRRDMRGHNDLDLNHGAAKRINDGLDGVKIIREIDQIGENQIENDQTWTAL